MGHSQTSKQICLFVAPGYGGAQVAVFYPPTAASSQWWLCQWENPSPMATATRQIVATFDEGGRFFRQPILRGWPSSSLHSSLLSSVHIHAVFGGGGPRWQPLNVAVATSVWCDASRRVSWRAEIVATEYSCNWTAAALIIGGAHDTLVFCRRWILNFVTVFVLYFTAFLY